MGVDIDYSTMSREDLKNSLDDRHLALIEQVSQCCDLSTEAIIESIAVPEQIKTLHNFTSAGGSAYVLFYHQNDEAGTSSSRPISGLRANFQNKNVFVTNGRDKRLTGKCVYFLRNPKKALEKRTLSKTTSMGMFESNQNGIVSNLEQLVQSVFLPALKGRPEAGWGKAESDKIVNFLESLDRFTGVIQQARESISVSVRLRKPDIINEEDFKTPADYVEAAKSSELVDSLEEIVAEWCKQIEQVLAESSQMRKEADDIGPKAELEHWKNRMAKFNALTDQIKSKELQVVVSIMHIAKSRLLKQWQQLDNRITDSANEAKDNVKYLYTLDRLCEPLYKCSPVELVDAIPGLLSAIKMIYSISRYYNTSERMTSLFVKITNQMITSCKSYIYNGNTQIWDHERAPLVLRLEHCMNLNDAYQKSFNRIKAELAEDASAKQFDFSEMYIFGKFDTFCKRSQRVISMLNVMDNFSMLETAQIEGIEIITKQFGSVVANIKRKRYDVLDHRKMEFDGDFEDFQRAMDNLMQKLQNFMDGAFDTVMSLERSLILLEKFAFLESFNLDVMDKYNRLLMQFGKEIEVVSKMYDKLKQQPPIQRNLPPVAGAVQWARQLYRRIEYPMSVFLKRPSILKSKEGKKIVRKYNRLARVLFEFEALYHKGWVKAVELAKSGLQASLLVRHPQTEELHVNFDPEVLQVIRESKCLQQVGLEIPASARLLCLEEQRIKDTYNRLIHLVQEYTRVKQQVPKIFFALCTPMLNKIDAAVEPGLLKLTWTSLNIDTYIELVNETLAAFEGTMDSIADIRECRIQASLAEVENTCLSEVPVDEPWDIQTFLNETEKACARHMDTLIRHNLLVEKATQDLIAIFKGSMTEEEALEYTDKFSDVVNFFSQRTIDSFTRCTRMSLDNIKRRLSTTSDKYGAGASGSSSCSQNLPPFFAASIKLSIPNIVVYPTIEDIQQCLNNSTSTIIGVMKHMASWNPAEAIASRKNYFTEISSNKDIVKILMMFNSAITSMKVGIAPILGEFSSFKEVWETDEKEKVQQFLASEPTQEQIEDEISKCEKTEAAVGSIINTYSVGSVQLCTDDLKMALEQMTKSYKIGLGRQLQTIAKSNMEEVMSFVADKQKRLARNVTDLEDIRLVMDALQDTREDEIRIEMLMAPIEDSYLTLNRLDLQVSKEEMEGVDTLRYQWNKLSAQVNEVQDHLIGVQSKYRGDLINTITDFKESLADFEVDYGKNGPKPRSDEEDGTDPYVEPLDAIERLAVFQRRFDDLYRKYETCSGGEALFGLPLSTYDAIDRTKRELKSLTSLYGLYKQVIDSQQQFNEMLWCEVDIEKNSQLLNDFQTKCRKLPKAAKDMPASNELKKLIDDMTETMPILELMSNKAMLPRHWRQIEEITKSKFEVEKTETFTLKEIMDAPILEHSEDVEDICVAATKEKDIDQKLTGIIGEWSAVNFTFTAFKGKEDMLLNGGATQEVVALMEDSLMALSSLLSNRYNVPFKENIQLWVQKLSKSSEIIDLWLVVQNLYAYLEAVFVGGDIAKDLPQEAKRFQQIDKQWVKLMSRAAEITNVVQVCTSDDTADQILVYLREQLELCQKSLSGYLETKRGLFPRFYFVSDPTLLEILGQASDSHAIQPHLCNVFDNCNTLNFASDDKGSREYNKIIGMNTRCGEHVDLTNTVMAEGVVEDWLDKLLTAMRQSINDVCRDAVQAVWRMELREFQDAYPAQVGLVGLQLKWTTESEEALAQARTDKKIMGVANKGHLDVLNTLIEITTLELTKMDRKKFETLVTTMVHNRDVFDVLVQNHVRVLTDFEWLKQSRTYWKEDLDTSIVSITDVDFEYQCEMLGIQERLCITPLTDRCYITLAQCMGMSLGGAPAGPAGTGKTETVKDMGRCLGKMVVVFNCSDQMDYRGLGRIFKGMTKSGSWVDFDEFNRIKLPVLSVAAGQIAVCLNSRRERKDHFIFTDGDACTMNKEMGVFITMNPGYAGRQELPENLKVQFRTVAMMVPDRQIIMRVKLASVGFKQNVMLAKKFFMLYKLCEQQLSKQTHYDFGLRNILSVLRTLGAVKRGNPEMTEQLIVMSVLRDMNIAKLIDEDEPLFMSLIDDLFPGLTVAAQQYPDLEEALKVHLVDMKLVWHDSWILKVIQLFETQRVRHGIAVLGPSGAGKTQAINIMMKSLTTLGVPHKDMRMNPKAITAEEMFGKLDVTTNDWTDGIFSTLWRRTHKTKPGDAVWIVLDGPVDTLWIESLNSVLDDNKTLTLANGDRIVMHPTCKMVFEVASLENASPATVSRNGMIYMSSSVLDYAPVLEAWIRDLSNTASETLRELFNESFPALYEFVISKCSAKMELLEANYIRQAIDIFKGLMAEREEASLTQMYFKRLYVFVIMWSLGGALEQEDRYKFLTKFMEYKVPDFPAGATAKSMSEYLVNDESEWVHWNTMVPEFKYPCDSIPNFSSILVPTVDSVRTEYLVNLIAKQKKAVLLIGEQGTAKTVTVQGYLDKLSAETHLYKTLNFSSFTSPGIFQRTLESYVEKRVGTTYGPSGGRKMTVFIDDVNMPYINEWGDQITNEIVRQVVEYDGFHSLDKPGDFINLADMQYIGAMIHPGGGRNDIPGRLKRHFSVFNCTLPTNESIDQIFGSIMTGYFIPVRDFREDVIATVAKLPQLTRELWQSTKVKMLPTPTKFHYVFNLRDLSRITEGMLRVTQEGVDSVNDMIALWKHECYRVIADRFNEESDGDWFEEAVRQHALECFGEDYREVIESESYFTDFMRDAPEADEDDDDAEEPQRPRIFERVESLQVLNDRLDFWMDQYNQTLRGSKNSLVFFKDAMTHLVKISRIISTSGGHALLVGVGGSGKQSLTRLASFVAGYDSFQITLSRTYGKNDLMEDLKELFLSAGVKDKGISFIFTDSEVKDEVFLEFMNNILTVGEVPGLLSKEELDEVRNNVRPEMKKLGLPQGNDQETEFFMNRVRKNLHIVLCFSPVGETFRRRALMFPGLISGCTCDWFLRWPKEALVQVAQQFVSNFKIECSDETKTAVVKQMGFTHDDVAETCVSYFQRYRRQTYVTPKSFLSFVNTYKDVYALKVNEIGQLAERMNQGLEKLIEASESVAVLKEELVVKEVDLATASKEADTVLVQVQKSAQEAEKVKSVVEVVAKQAQELVESIGADKAVAMKELEAAGPALAAAESALSSIQPAHISTVRKLAKPPHLIMRIMDGVLMLLKKPLLKVEQDPERPCMKPSWSEALKVMSQSTFLSSLMNYPKDEMNDEQMELLEPLLKMEDFTVDRAKSVCGDVAGLCSWVQSMFIFYGVNKKVIPLKDNLQISEHRLQQAQKEFTNAAGTLADKQKELDACQLQFDEAMRKKQLLLDDADMCRRKMSMATALITGLSGEKVRWTQQSKAFADQIGRLVGDVLMTCAFLSYAGPFNQEYRVMVLNRWKDQCAKNKISHSENLDLVNLLVHPTVVQEWHIQTLPKDALSIQNGILVTKASRYPLLIDPQMQGKTWIKAKEVERGLIVTSLKDKYFRIHLEDSLSQGKPLLIEDVEEELDPVLYPLLEKNFIRSGRSLKVKLGDKEVDVMEKFTLYMTTKLANPRYTPEISAMAAIIDFTVTMKGLEDQLLGLVILNEKQELERELMKLMKEVSANNKKMKDLEDSLLYRLTSTKGSLVDDEGLVDMLATTKTTAEEVGEKLVVAADTEQKINIAREEYRPIATRGSILYFLIVEMSLVNFMYQIALTRFLQLFQRAMEDADSSPIPAKRIENIIETLTWNVFAYTVRGLYEKDKFLFTLMLCLKIDLNKQEISFAEFNCFIKGGASLDLNTVQKKPAAWIPDLSWLNLVQLSKLPQFNEILNQVSRNERGWKLWYDKDAPEEAQLQDGYQNKLSAFERLLLVRGWSADRTVAAARTYIQASLGLKYAEGVILNLDSSWKESTVSIPLICFLSLGGDPTAGIEGLAKSKKIPIMSLSMGQGQEAPARRAMQSMRTEGGWVLFQNCHLGIEFMEELLLQIMDKDAQPHENFRLWMTTEVCGEFPISMLQQCLQYTNEPPNGYKAGLKRTYNWVTQEMLDVSNLPPWRPLVFATSFLHTTVLERRKFGSLGWNIPYEFNHSDLAATIQFMQNHLDDVDLRKGVSWPTIHYMIGEVQYGGRVTDDFDQRMLNTYVDLWFGEHMFADDFRFCKSLTQYVIPKASQLTEIREAIEHLPLSDSPEVFGLHPNADITYSSNIANEALSTIVDIQPKESAGGGSGETREDCVKRQADELLEKLPNDFDPFEVKANIRKQGGPTPLNVCLRQEIDRIQRVLSLVRETLTDLKLAIDGVIIMSAGLADALNCMFDGRVPCMWQNISWESTTLGFWFMDLVDRTTQLSDWLYTGKPHCFWLTGFFNPQGFLTSLRQTITRAHKGWSLDSVYVTTDATKMFKEEVQGPPPEGLYIYGLFLEGAGWDRRSARLCESAPKVLFVPLPVVHVSATVQLLGKSSGIYECPVYTKPRRTDLCFIFTVDLRTQVPASNWIVRGTALLCATS